MCALQRRLVFVVVCNGPQNNALSRHSAATSETVNRCWPLVGLPLLSSLLLEYSAKPTISTSSSAIAERPRCRVGYLWPKVEDWN